VPQSTAPWRVLLIAGASGVGKTTVSRMLARRWSVGLAQADDFRLVLAQQSGSLRAHESQADTAEDLCDRWIETARSVSAALQIVVAFHVATDAPCVLEGDTVLPELAALSHPMGVPVGSHVHAVVLAAESEALLWRNARARGRGFQVLSPVAQARTVRRNWLYGQWLVDEAVHYGVPVIPVRESDTAERIADAIDATHGDADAPHDHAAAHPVGAGR
jgi:2-phosphoglycerate kinase